MIDETGELASEGDVTRFVARAIEREARREAGERVTHRRDGVYLASLRVAKWGMESEEPEASEGDQGEPEAREARERAVAVANPSLAREGGEGALYVPLGAGGEETRKAERDPRRRARR